MPEGMAGQAASTGTRNGAIAVVFVNQQSFLQEVHLHCPSAFRQLLYTVSRLVCDSSTSSPARSVKLCREAGWGLKEAGWKHK